MTTVNTIGNFQSVGNAPGVVPLGAIIAMTTGLTGAMAIPASGVVSNGYMRADGVAIPANNAVSGTPPNLSTSIFLRGASTFSGTGGGTATLIAANIPSLTSTGTVTNTGTTVANTTGAGSTHSHGVGTYVNSASGVTGSVGGGDGTHTHTISDPGHFHTTNDTGGITIGANASGHSDAPGGSAFSTNTDTKTTGISVTSSGSGHGHGFSLTALAQTISGSSAAESAHTHPIPSLTVNSGQTVSVTSTGTSGTAFNVIPNYIDVIYLVRVN